MKILKKLTKKNLHLNKKRTIVTIIGIILSIALLTAVTSLVTTFKSSLLIYEINADGNYNFKFEDVPKNDIVNFTSNKSIDFISKVGLVGYANGNTKNDAKPYIKVIAYDKNALENLMPTLESGRLPENDTEIVVSKHLKTNGGVKLEIGQQITLDVGTRIYENPGEVTFIYDEDGEIIETEETNENDSLIEELGTDDYIEGETLTNTVTKTYTVVGFVDRLDYELEGYTDPGYSVITYSDNFDSFDVYAKYTKSGLENKYQVTADLTGITDSLYVDTNGFFNLYSYCGDNNKTCDERVEAIYDSMKYEITENYYLNMLEGNLFKDESFRFMLYIAAIILMIIVMTSVFCIKNSFDISITEKTKMYGLLRSVGATKKQIKRNVLYEAFVLGIIGIPLGILFGIFATWVLTVITNKLIGEFLNLSLTLNVSIIGILISSVLGIVTIYLSAIKSAQKASRISPITAIRNNDDIKGKKIKTNRLIKKIFGVGGNISDKNLKRNKKKYQTTIGSIMVCVLTFVALSSFMDFAMESVEMEVGSYDYNIELALSEDDQKLNDSLIDYASKNDLVDDYVVLKRKSGYLKNVPLNNHYEELYRATLPEEDKNQDLGQVGSISITSLGDYQYRKYIEQLGLNYDDVKNKAILVDTTLFEYETTNHKTKKEKLRETNYQVGDNIDLYAYNPDFDYETTSSDEKLIKEDTVEVAYVTDVKPFGFSDENEVLILVVSDEYYNTLSNAYDEYFGGDYSYLYIQSNDADSLQEELESIITDDSINVFNLDQEYREMKALFLLIEIFLYGFIVVIALIGITNIFNTITTTVALRAREFATLKSVGMTTKEFNHMIRLESLFLGFKSLILGIPVGTYLGYLIYRLLTEGGGDIVSYHLPYKGIAISVTVVFLLIFGLMKYSVNKVNKQNIIETIRNENI